MSNAKDAITRRVQRMLGRDQERLSTGIKITGNRFLVTWSNNFEDRDGEIFTQKAIDHYVARVDAGLVPPPALWVWHAGKSTQIGQVSQVARYGHFIVAIGEFETAPTAQNAKAYYERHAKNTTVSHGFTYPVSKFDGKHYHEFNTFEISLLPRGVEANRYTALERIKEMSFTPDKQKYLEEVFGADVAKDILADLDKRGKALEEIGAAYKDFTGDVPTASAVKDVGADLKDFMADLIRDSAGTSEFAADAFKALKQHGIATEAAIKAVRADLEAQIAAQAKTIAALQEQLDSRPRMASTAAETELTAVRLEAMKESVAKQNEKVNSFWGTKETGE